jgi:hypothetical protein
LGFKVPVRAVRLRRDKIVVALSHKVYVYNFSDLRVESQMDTSTNDGGLVVISPTTERMVLACPGLNKGQIRVELFDGGTTKFIAAHESALACLALSADGRLLASASEKGTLIRVFDTHTGELLHEFRRGSDKAIVYSLAFNAKNTLLGVTSDKGTVHVFRVPRQPSASAADASASPAPAVSRDLPAARSPPITQGDSQSGDRDRAALGKIVKKFLPKYFSSEWSLAQFKLPSTHRALVSFPAADPDSCVVISEAGDYSRLVFDERQGGEMMCVESHRFDRLAVDEQRFASQQQQHDEDSLV